MLGGGAKRKGTIWKSGKLDINNCLSLNRQTFIRRRISIDFQFGPNAIHG